MRIHFIGNQALSRIYNIPSNKWNFTSKPENPIKYEVQLELVKTPFDIAIAQPVGRGITAGAFEYFDEELDEYLTERWPMQLIAKGWFDSDHDWLYDNMALRFARKLMWVDIEADMPIAPDQRQAILGYRREFYHRQRTDIMNRRRPSPENIFVPTEVNEPYGPGLVTLQNFINDVLPNELVWSEIIKFPGRTVFEKDKDVLVKAINAQRRHFNSHSELRDCRRYLSNSDRKAAVRSAASAVDASLLQCIEVNSLKMPPAKTFKGLDTKITKALELACLPPFMQLAPEHARNIRYLYRARNKMHEGDCYYATDDGTTVQVVSIDQVRPLVESAQAFVLWMDTQL